MAEQEPGDVSAERTSTFLCTIPQSASNYTVIHSISGIVAQWGGGWGGQWAGDTSSYVRVNKQY